MKRTIKGPWVQVRVDKAESVAEALNDLDKTHIITGVVWDGEWFNIFGKEMDPSEMMQTFPVIPRNIPRG